MFETKIRSMVIGRGEHADHILLSKGEDGKWRLPGRIVRQDENIKKAAERAVYEKHGKHATPRMFAGLMQEWLPDGKTLRDDREPTVGFLYVSEMSGGAFSEVRDNEQWFPLFNKERTGISEELVRLKFAFHHNEELKLVVDNLLLLGVVQKDDPRSVGSSDFSSRFILMGR